MAETTTVWTVKRTPYTAAAKNTLGYASVELEVVAANEGEAIRKAQGVSAYASREFSWRVTGARILTPDPDAKGADRERCGAPNPNYRPDDDPLSGASVG